MPGHPLIARMRDLVLKLEQRLDDCHSSRLQVRCLKTAGARERCSTVIDDLERQVLSLEEDLAQSRAEKEAAEEANRAKDRLLAMISHDLRTPLSGILLWAKALRDGVGTDEERLEAAEAITRMAHEQLGLVNDLLDLSRMIHGQMKLRLSSVDLGQVVRGAVADIAGAGAACGRRIEVELGEPVVLQGDADRLRQAVWNLLGNAVKFTPPDGRIRINMHRRGDRVCLVVSDTGCGIPPKLLPRIFEPFVSGEAHCGERVGLGLGLSIVKHIVELHGGRIRARSNGAGQGTSFEVELPAAGCRSGCRRSVERSH